MAIYMYKEWVNKYFGALWYQNKISDHYDKFCKTWDNDRMNTKIYSGPLWY